MRQVFFLAMLSCVFFCGHHFHSHSRTIALASFLLKVKGKSERERRNKETHTRGESERQVSEERREMPSAFVCPPPVRKQLINHSVWRADAMAIASMAHVDRS